MKMEPKNMLELVVGIAVGVLVLSAALFPVIDSATATEHTLTNEGYSRYASIESTSEDVITISWDHTNPKYLTIGDDQINCSSLQSYTSIIFGDDWAIRYITAAGSTLSTTIQYIGPTASEYMQVTTAGTADLTITLEAGDMTVTDGTTTKTADYTSAYYPNSDGSMVMKKSDSKAYLLKDSSIINANGSTQVGSVGVGVHFEGTVADGYEFTLYRNTNNTEVSNVESNYVENGKYLGVIELTNITFDMTPEGGTATAATYSYFLVPYQITAELAVHASEDEIEILETIPILIIIGLIMGIVGMIAARRYE